MARRRTRRKGSGSGGCIGIVITLGVFAICAGFLGPLALAAIILLTLAVGVMKCVNPVQVLKEEKKGRGKK